MTWHYMIYLVLHDGRVARNLIPRPPPRKSYSLQIIQDADLVPACGERYLNQAAQNVIRVPGAAAPPPEDRGGYKVSAC